MMFGNNLYFPFIPTHPILAMIVNVEKPELEQEKQTLVRQQNEFKVTLAQLEDDLLAG